MNKVEKQVHTDRAKQSLESLLAYSMLIGLSQSDLLHIVTLYEQLANSMQSQTEMVELAGVKVKTVNCTIKPIILI